MLLNQQLPKLDFSHEIIMRGEGGGWETEEQQEDTEEEKRMWEERKGLRLPFGVWAPGGQGPALGIFSWPLIS